MIDKGTAVSTIAPPKEQGAPKPLRLKELGWRFICTHYVNWTPGGKLHTKWMLMRTLGAESACDWKKSKLNRE